MVRRRSQAENVFELLRSVLGGKVIMVADRRTGQVIWKDTTDSTCGYESSGIDSEQRRNAEPI